MWDDESGYGLQSSQKNISAHNWENSFSVPFNRYILVGFFSKSHTSQILVNLDLNIYSYITMILKDLLIKAYDNRPYIYYDCGVVTGVISLKGFYDTGYYDRLRGH